MKKKLLVVSIGALIALGPNTLLYAQTSLQQQPQQLQQQQLLQQQLQLQAFTACRTQCSSSYNLCTLGCSSAPIRSADVTIGLGDRQTACLTNCSNSSAACGQGCTGR